MDTRYQVFVSSTFDDLKEERKVIIENLLNAKYIPAGMELFSASNDEQFEYIKKIIDTCDYYVLIIAARYGSINPSTGLSFTEQEYDYAKSKGIPILTFLHSDPYNLPSDKREDDKRELLEQFRKKASSGRLCRMWSSITDLTSSVLISLNDQVSENPQKGWVRGDSKHDDSDIIEKLNGYDKALINEVEHLKKQIAEYAKELSVKDAQIANLKRLSVNLSNKLEQVQYELERAQNDIEDQYNTFHSINEKVVMHYAFGQLETTWKDILIRTKNTLTTGCPIKKLNRKLSHVFINGGEIDDNDVEKIIDYMTENKLWVRVIDNLIITGLGVKLCEKKD